MDDVLKRRLLGALVLLTAAFLFASLLPEPGQPPEPKEPVVRYDLRTGEAEKAPATAATRAPAAPARRPALQVDETLGADAPAWFVQVGSFENPANARGALQKLYGLGLPTVIQSVSVGDALWYRVRVGPYTDEPAAQRTLARIRKEGYAAAKVVRIDPSASVAN